VRPVETARHVQTRWLILHGDRDPLVPPAAAQALADARPGTPHVYYAGTHDQPTNTEMQRLTLAFFAGVDESGPDRHVVCYVE
jgi:pimeloyl-ACP methyl ester carboxylesterase